MKKLDTKTIEKELSKPLNLDIPTSKEALTKMLKGIPQDYRDQNSITVEFQGEGIEIDLRKMTVRKEPAIVSIKFTPVSEESGRSSIADQEDNHEI